jgi:putative transposase
MSPEYAVEIRDACKTYMLDEIKVQAICDVNLKIRKGEFVSIYRRKMFGAELLAKRVEATLREIANRYKMQIHALKVLEDHVHIFVNFKPSMSLSAVFQYLKGISSYEIFKDFPWLKTKFHTGHLWSRGKFFRTVGSVTAEAIEHYINESQKKHLFY